MGVLNEKRCKTVFYVINTEFFVIGWFRSTSSSSHSTRNATITLQRLGLICAPSSFDFSIAHIRHSLHCVHLPIYHRVVSINRPSGYEPDALPLRHDDGLSLCGFEPHPPTFCWLARFHYASMTWLIRPTFRV